MLHVTTYGREKTQGSTWIPPDFACLFSLCYPAMCPYCVVIINPSYKYNHTFSPVSLPIKSLNTGVTLGEPDTVVANMGVTRNSNSLRYSYSIPWGKREVGKTQLQCLMATELHARYKTASELLSVVKGVKLFMKFKNNRSIPKTCTSGRKITSLSVLAC